MTYKMLGKSNGLVNGYREKKKKIEWSGLSNLGFFFFVEYSSTVAASG